MSAPIRILRAAVAAGAIATVVSAQPQPPAISGTYQVDRMHTSVVFKVRHLGVSNFYGTFNDVTGHFAIDESNPAASSFELQIKAESIDSRDPARDQHLKGPDFFNAKQYPLLQFKSTKVAKAPDGARDLEVSGDLTIHGVARPLTVKLAYTGAGPGLMGEDLVGFEAQFAVKRSEFGMNFMVDQLGDDVQIFFSIEGVKKK